MLSISTAAPTNIPLPSPTALPQSALSSFPLMNSHLSDPQGILQSYINLLIIEYGIPPPIVPYVYGLPCSLADIKKGRYDGIPNQLYGTTIDHCMKLQNSPHLPSNNESDTLTQHQTEAVTSPFYCPGLPIPRLVLVLLDLLSRTGAYTAEGIFRISVSKNELTTVRTTLSGGDYSVLSLKNIQCLVDGAVLPNSGGTLTVHVLANLLKEWFRDLNDPLFNRDQYQVAIQWAKKYTDSISHLKEWTNHGNVATTTRPIQVTELEQFYLSLDGVVQKMLIILADYLSPIVLDDHHHQLNKMTLENLAVVFAPCFLRFPTSSHTPSAEEAMEQMKHAKLEVRFVAGLFKFLMQDCAVQTGYVPNILTAKAARNIDPALFRVD